MSTSDVQPQAGHLDQLSDTVAAMVAHLLQEQLAPIIETLREHARLLDCHTALLNHSTTMNRYNVGKLEDLRDLQNSVK
jgi:precorrin-4 methylase